MRTCGQTITPGLIYYCDQCSKGKPCVEPGPHVAVCNQLREELHAFMAGVSRDLLRLSSRIDTANSNITMVAESLDRSVEKLNKEHIKTVGVMNHNVDKLNRMFTRGYQ